jgi:hypothetical protein
MAADADADAVARRHVGIRIMSDFGSYFPPGRGAVSRLRPRSRRGAGPDETAFVKKGAHSAGCSGSTPGTAGRIENSQVDVFFTYASPRGPALVDQARLRGSIVSVGRVRCPAEKRAFTADM